ncbi:MAG TPA: orotidine-5'-phosphate decarboxylase [Fimbriiglobus sp.]|jgi:orotidine-5'-phosphate decarboxylase
MDPFPDRLAYAVRRYGPLCVGLDPRMDTMPKRFQTPANPADGIESFCVRLLELVRPFCGVVKPQSAFFELFGPAGMRALQSVLRRAKEMGFLTILDAKRGDIASTAAAYAEAAFGPTWDADALTVNPYLGADAVEPFVMTARAAGKGVFVLVRTSNPGAGLFQDLVCDGQPIYRHVATAVNSWNAPGQGKCALGDVGAVVGATHSAELNALRIAMPNVWFLVPGYGAQGATAADVKAAFRSDGLGAVVNSSRGVTFPYHPDAPEWEAKVIAAATRARDELGTER